MTADAATDVVLIGAGPVGLRVAWELQRAGVAYRHLERDGLASTVERYPAGTRLYSAPAALAFPGMPMKTRDPERCTREEYLTYLRDVARDEGLEVETGVAVTAVKPRAEGGFDLELETPSGRGRIRARRVVFATGASVRPRRLGIPGEDLPHASHWFPGPEEFRGARVLVVGGGNSAKEAAVRCADAGAEVTLSYRRRVLSGLHEEVKREARERIASGSIRYLPETRPRAITESHVELVGPDGRVRREPAERVLLLTGYLPDLGLLEAAGVRLKGVARRPSRTLATMETGVPGLYVAGAVGFGERSEMQLGIDRSQLDGLRIAAHLTGGRPPRDPAFLRKALRPRVLRKWGRRLARRARRVPRRLVARVRTARARLRGRIGRGP